MCIWSQADATFSTHPRRVQVRNQRGKTVERRVKQVDYIWDLDDGAPGFLKQTRRDRLKLYVDTDRNGMFTRGDVLLGKTKITRRHRLDVAANLLPDDQVGQIIAFNAVESNAADPSPLRDKPPGSSNGSKDHIDLLAGVGLRFMHPDGSVVAVFGDLSI